MLLFSDKSALFCKRNGHQVLLLDGNVLVAAKALLFARFKLKIEATFCTVFLSIFLRINLIDPNQLRRWSFSSLLIHCKYNVV